MLVTVLMCTWNRAELLDRTLTEMQKLKIPPGVEWELLVVNNNCTDNSDDVIRRHAEVLPIRRLFEKEQGVSNAKNCGIAAAKGELILWTDDDVRVDPQWFSEYVRAAEKWPEASFFGGKIEPEFASSPPEWLRRTLSDVASVYGIRDFGDAPRALDPDTLPLGANYAVRTAIQKRYLSDPRFGRKGRGHLRGSETPVMRQMLADGLQGRWVPGARVLHYVPEQHQTLAFCRHFYFNMGKYVAVCDRDRQERASLRSRFWIFRQALTAELKHRAMRLYAQPEAWIEDFRQANYWWGRLLG